VRQGGAEASEAPHQFRTRNGVNELQRKQPDTNKKGRRSTKLVDILPLITVWLQVRVYWPKSEISGSSDAALDHRTRHNSIL
jgi:hypothetical protein